MTNSIDRDNLRSAVDTISSLIGTKTLQRLIDEPLLLAAESFDKVPATPVSCQSFLTLIGKFVRHLYTEGVGTARHLTTFQARAEAISILEEGYEGPDSRGFDAALLDATDPTRPGIDWVLQQITGAIITKHRSQHVRWVFETHLNVLDWASKCYLAEFLVVQNRPFLPETLLDFRSTQLAHQLAELITILVAAEERFELIRSGHINRP